MRMSSFIGLCTVLCVLVTLQSALCFGVSLRSARVRSSSSLYMGTTLVFGGTGKTGSECVYQSLQAGENVIVLARDPAKMIYPESDKPTGLKYEAMKYHGYGSGFAKDPKLVRQAADRERIN